MKGLTLSAVEWMMDLLIHTNGQTTTKEVKEALREVGYYAEQDTISKMMSELYDANNEEAKLYNCENNGNYKIYSFTDIITSQVPTATDVEPDVVDDTVDEDDSDNDNDNDNDISSTFSASGLSQYRSIGTPGAGKAMTIREPELIFYTDKHARNSGVDSQSWIVSHVNGNNEIQVYNKDLNRDQVRSRYASILKVKIQDVRARRFANY